MLSLFFMLSLNILMKLSCEFCICEHSLLHSLCSYVFIISKTIVGLESCLSFFRIIHSRFLKI
ncbi:hypothetical protein M758_5G176100 [Ceratodon purpureus]|uniref:NADH dehydrogenase subunit 4L n=1 Tax=Ceratodon purpureus TaxID=3225 RepID=A0A8T0I4Z6_CERPU|nr:hypothetical protein KC19_5G183100 [Ceratodon purpureus]KAG0617245.1 hypothetical protein M758_5G176100 [Ceratodon purpureus]